MDREQTKAIIKEIRTFYDTRFKIENPADLIDTWHKALKDYDFEDVSKNLDEYIKSGERFPPVLADLIKSRRNPKMYDNAADTKKLLENMKSNRADDQTAAEELRKMREILGIRR